MCLKICITLSYCNLHGVNFDEGKLKYRIYFVITVTCKDIKNFFFPTGGLMVDE
jgi:hypothetical protein